MQASTPEDYTMSSSENRRSFRVSESMYLQYEVISEEEFAGGIERRRVQTGGAQGIRSQLMDLDARLDEKLFLLKQNNKQVAEILAMINDKISIAVDQLPVLKEQKTTLAKTAPQVCEISADGMVFGAGEAFAPDTKLALRLLLESDSRYVESFARVVRLTDPPAEDRDRAVGVAVEFVGMPPAQKEILIQHLFSRESETLRMRRLQLDNMG